MVLYYHWSITLFTNITNIWHNINFVLIYKERRLFVNCITVVKSYKGKKSSTTSEMIELSTPG